MTIAMYPGRFDPVTNGHIDIVDRSSKLFDHVIIAVARGNEESNLFSAEERAVMFNESIRNSGVCIIKNLL